MCGGGGWTTRPGSGVWCSRFSHERERSLHPPHTCALYLPPPGASWFNSVLGFAQLSSLDDFLGPYVPPSTLTPAELQKV